MIADMKLAESQLRKIIWEEYFRIFREGQFVEDQADVRRSAIQALGPGSAFEKEFTVSKEPKSGEKPAKPGEKPAVSGKLPPPSKESIEIVNKAIKKGAAKAQKVFVGDLVLDSLKTVSKKAGFADPCKYVRQNRNQIEKEVGAMQKAAKSLQETDDPAKNLNRFHKIIKMLGGASLIGTMLSGVGYSKAMYASKEALTAYQLAAKSASAVGWDAAAAKATASISAISSKAMAAGSVLGMTVATWATIGGILLAIGIAIWVYKWMLKTGAACKIKEFALKIGRGIKSGVEWAYKKVVAPFAEKISDWGSKLVKTVTSWFKEEQNRKSGDFLLENRYQQKAVEAIRQWNKLNEVALTIHYDCKHSYF